MTTATLTAKGQTTIPKTVRNYLGLKSGDKLDFIIEPDGGVTIRPFNRPINVDTLSLAGYCYKVPSADIMGGVSEHVLQENLSLNAYNVPSEIAKPHSVSAIEYLLSLPAGESTPEAVMARIEYERDAWQ